MHLWSIQTYLPKRTTWSVQAETAGCIVIRGIDMLIAQVKYKVVCCSTSFMPLNRQ